MRDLSRQERLFRLLCQSAEFQRSAFAHMQLKNLEPEPEGISFPDEGSESEEFKQAALNARYAWIHGASRPDSKATGFFHGKRLTRGGIQVTSGFVLSVYLGERYSDKFSRFVTQLLQLSLDHELHLNHFGEQVDEDVFTQYVVGLEQCGLQFVDFNGANILRKYAGAYDRRGKFLYMREVIADQETMISSSTRLLHWDFGVRDPESFLRAFSEVSEKEMRTWDPEHTAGPIGEVKFQVGNFIFRVMARPWEHRDWRPPGVPDRITL